MLALAFDGPPKVERREPVLGEVAYEIFVYQFWIFVLLVLLVLSGLVFS